MNAKCLAWVWPEIVTIGALLACAGCGSSVTASNGSIFRPSEAMPDAFSSALVASASHDLPCADSNLDVEHLVTEREYSVTGCGLRVLYRVMTPALNTRRIELVSRSALPANGDRAESKSAAAQL